MTEPVIRAEEEEEVAAEKVALVGEEEAEGATEAGEGEEPAKPAEE